MNKFVPVLLSLFSSFTGIIFLYSAYTKLSPIQLFEYTMVEYVHLPWMAAAIGARFLVGLEAGLGILIAVHCYGTNKWVLKTAFSLLIAFSVYLVILWARAGNIINCGCFGDAIWMSPAAALIKNVILLVIIGALIRRYKGFNAKPARLLAPAILSVMIILPFFLFVIPLGKPGWLRKDKYKIDLSILNSSPDNSGQSAIVGQSQNIAGKTDAEFGETKTPYNFNKGKYIVAFVSQACPHCRIAAYKMHLMKQHNGKLPFFMIIGGTTSDLTDFWNETRAQNIPHTRLEKNAFLQFTGGVFPTILWINDGWVEAKEDYTMLDQPTIEKWLAE